MKVLIILALVAVAVADVSHIIGHQQYQQQPIPYQRPIAILRQVQETSGLGDYRYSFDTENGIHVQEEAVQKNLGRKDEAKEAHGSYSYTGPDGQTYTVQWVADADGYRASGAHLPVAPEIPAEIKRSLELIAAQPQRDEGDDNQ